MNININDLDIDKLIIECEKENESNFLELQEITYFNQEKVLNAFKENKVALRHFQGSTGYGYEDEGKHIISSVLAQSFGAEKAIVSPLLASGTHTISTALFGLLRPNDELLIISGTPYDTLLPVINGDNIGSLKEFGVKHSIIDLKNNGEFDVDAIINHLTKYKSKVVLMQRSRGYTWRNPLSIKQTEEIVKKIKQISPDTVVTMDNCYGEFTEKIEPTQVGVDVIMGSFIKNPGGGIAPTGGYIAGKQKYIDLIDNRLTAPGVGTEVGSCASGYRTYFQGFFMSPHTTMQALKGALLFRSVFSALGYNVLPNKDSVASDIICSIEFKSKDEVVKFCQAIQKSSPVDSFALPMPWDMPGYDDQVIMAAGTFVQGASIELSADAPMRKPYIVYLQGGLTYEHVRIAVKQCVNEIFNAK